MSYQGRFKKRAAFGIGLLTTRHPRMGAAELPWVAIWLPLKRRELRDSGSYIATFVRVR